MIGISGPVRPRIVARHISVSRFDLTHAMNNPYYLYTLDIFYRYLAGDLRNVASLFLRTTNTCALNLSSGSNNSGSSNSRDFSIIFVYVPFTFFLLFRCLIPILYRCLAGDLRNLALSFIAATNTHALNLSSNDPSSNGQRTTSKTIHGLVKHVQIGKSSANIDSHIDTFLIHF